MLNIENVNFEGSSVGDRRYRNTNWMHIIIHYMYIVEEYWFKLSRILEIE